MTLLAFYQISSLVILFVDDNTGAQLFEMLEAFYSALTQADIWTWPYKTVHPKKCRRMKRMTVVFTLEDDVLWLTITIDGKYTVFEGFPAMEIEANWWTTQGYNECVVCKKLPKQTSGFDADSYGCRPKQVVINIHMPHQYNTNLRIEAFECAEIVKHLLTRGIGFGRSTKPVNSVIITKRLNSNLSKKRTKVRVDGKLFYSGSHTYRKIRSSRIGLCACSYI